MKAAALCLLVIGLVALLLRAGVAQQVGGYRANDPYAPGAQQSRPGVDNGRYPLPQAPGMQPPPAFQPPAMPAVVPAVAALNVPAQGQVPAPGQAAVAPALREPVVRTNLFQPGVTVARVGDRCIFYGDIAPTVSMELDAMASKAQTAADREEIEGYREQLTKLVLPPAVQSKMLYLEFERDIMKKGAGGDAKKMAEARGKMDKNVRSVFERVLTDYREKIQNATPEQTQKLLSSERTVVRLALLMKEKQLESNVELDLALRKFGTSLDQQMAIFGERQMGYEVVRKHLSGKKYEVSHQEMLDDYREHLAEYAVPARARYEILTVRFANVGRPEAFKLITEMGNAVFLGGTPFAAVAKKSSQEPNAGQGGYYDWTNQGSLASKPINDAIFSIDLDKLSQVIEDDNGYHIVRVKEREGATVVSFMEAQPEIKKGIEAKKKNSEQQKFLEEIQSRTQIWTIYDPPGGREAAAGAGGVRR